MEMISFNIKSTCICLISKIAHMLPWRQKSKTQKWKQMKSRSCKWYLSLIASGYHLFSTGSFGGE